MNSYNIKNNKRNSNYLLISKTKLINCNLPKLRLEKHFNLQNYSSLAPLNKIALEIVYIANQVKILKQMNQKYLIYHH